MADAGSVSDDPDFARIGKRSSSRLRTGRRIDAKLQLCAAWRSSCARQGHRSVATLRKYIRKGELFTVNGATKLGL